MKKIISMLREEGVPKIKIIFLCLVASLILIACGSSGGGDDNGGDTTNVSGYWALYHTKTGGTEEGPGYWTLTQSGNNIAGSWLCEDSESITGSINENNISLSFSFGETGIYGEDAGAYGSTFEFEFEEMNPSTTGTYTISSDFEAIDFQNSDTPYNLHAYGGSVTITSISPIFEGTFTLTDFAQDHGETPNLSGSVSGSFSVPDDGSANGTFIAQGTVDGYDIDINASTAEYNPEVSLSGTITDNAMEGTYTSYDSSGTWRTEKRTTEPQCEDEDGGVYIDAFQFSGTSNYCCWTSEEYTWFTSNFSNSDGTDNAPSYATNAPDGNYAIMYSGGFSLMTGTIATVQNGIKIYIVSGSLGTYEVYGGNSIPTSLCSFGTPHYTCDLLELGNNPQNYGFQYLGGSNTTQEFSGSYLYYIVKTD